MGMEADGIIVIDKPAEMTSARVVAVVKKLLQAKKVGHTGTLDPFATGVLICCLNRATRLAKFFLSGPKVYEAVLRLGVATDTQDATGAVLSRCEKIECSEEKIRSVVQRFTGNLEQRPPVFSALKHQGVPLYRLARSGRAVQKPARRVHIAAIDIRAVRLPEVHLTVSCSAGTYIRTLCADIGAALACGGHLQALRRVESCGFTIREAISLARLKEALSRGKGEDYVIDMAGALRGIPAHTGSRALAQKIRHGKTITDGDILAAAAGSPAGDFIKVLDPENRLLAVLRLPAKAGVYEYSCVFQA